MIETRRNNLPPGLSYRAINRWRRARITRLMQASTNPRLVIENDPAFGTNSLKPQNKADAKIIKKIQNYILERI